MASIPNIGNFIAQDVSRAGGYDYQFVEDPSDDLKCLICLCVARDPQQHGDGGCGKIFCMSCIDKYKKNDDKCPNCRKVIATFKDERSKYTHTPSLHAIVLHKVSLYRMGVQ